MRLKQNLLSATALLVLMWVTGFATVAHAEVVNIDNSTLERLISEGVAIVDVRRADEWESTGVVDKSELLTFFDAQGNYDAAAWLAKLGSIAGRGDPLILICRSGSRSKMISQFLSEKAGYTTVYNVAGGILSWQANGGRLVSP
jgi:rhodanese-related sulfurtransferase